MADISIVICYIIATVVVGYIAGSKVKTMKDFAVANKTFPTAVLVSTIFATWMGGDDLIGVSERIYSLGCLFLLVVCAQTFSLLIHAYVIAPKILRDFSSKISIGEIMGELYGKPGQVLSGIASMFFSIGYVAVQVSSIGYVCNLFFGVSHFYGTIIGSLVIIMYSSIGGIRSVVFTDVLQFGILTIGIPLMASVALGKVGGFSSLVNSLPPSHLDLGPSNNEFWSQIAFLVVCAFPYFNPMLMQRILMARGTKQATLSLTVSGILYIPFYLVIAIIALCAVVLFPGIDPNNAFLSVLNHSLPPVVKGIAISGVCAVVMSTADSFLNLASVSATRDVFGVLMKDKLSDKMELRISRIVTVVFGFASIYVATMFTHMIDFSIYFSNFWAPTVIAPMLLYIFGYKTDIKTYLYSLATGLVAIIIYRYSMPDDFNIVSQLFGAFVTLICMFFFGILNSKRCIKLKPVIVSE